MTFAQKFDIKNKELFTEIKLRFSSRSGAHDLNHILRVLKNTQIISKNYDCDVRILEAMVCLHDLVRFENNKSAESLKHTIFESKKILGKLNYSQDEIDKIISGILTHSLHSKEKKIPSTVEGKILFDADKIDAAGYIGIVRWFYYCSNKGMSIENAAQTYLQELYEVRKHNPDILYTTVAKKLIKNKLKVSEDFMLNLLDEIKL